MLINKQLSKKQKKWLYTAIAISLFGVILFLVHVPILRGVGGWLISEDAQGEQAVPLFVLGGNSYERGKEAAGIYKAGYANTLICVGGNVPQILLALNINKTEGEVTEIYVKELGVPNSAVKLINESSSTKEESEAILNYCRENNYKKIAILSSLFHTRRVARTFKDKFEAEGIQVLIWGSANTDYDILEWWKSEAGMVTLFNEYVKHLYYFLKY